jgi:DNA-binding PadR family transcriptional regulator
MSSRYFGHGELPLVLLALLAQQPRHGYDLMGELARLFGPAYRPSPGSIYPAVEALEAEQLIAGKAAGGRTTYSATLAGRDALATRSRALAAIEVRTGARLGDEASLEPLLARFVARLTPLSGRIDNGEAGAVLDRAATDIEALHTHASTMKETRR